uniref:Uncharacterized protein n=1 Tax=Hanusia phi TaxID=3032 RepID=A0A7S0HTV0_9CRYP
MPSQAKCRLIAAMRSYMNSESTPEAFAEAIKTLVDEFHVVVPTGSGRDQRLAMPVKRRLDATAAAPLAKRGRQEPKVEAICYGGTLGMRAKGMSSKAAGVGAEDSSEAWEALVSVCSML